MDKTMINHGFSRMMSGLLDLDPGPRRMRCWCRSKATTQWWALRWRTSWVPWRNWTPSQVAFSFYYLLNSFDFFCWDQLAGKEIPGATKTLPMVSAWWIQASSSRPNRCHEWSPKNVRMTWWPADLFIVLIIKCRFKPNDIIKKYT